MATHKVMDHTGHSTVEFNTADKVSVKEAEKRFNDLVKVQKMVAFEPGPNGKPGRLLKDFDPNVEETIFHPSLQGG